MEENVALDSNKQKRFTKSLKKLMQKKNTEAKSAGGENVKSGRISKKKCKQRGLVYLAHIPHGFYENEMTQYFKQFGVVTNARVIKSKHTGRSKGYAFVEFKEPTVAQIVAETMNNYLMGKRLIKASLIPPEKQRRAFRKHWNSIHNPGNEMRIKLKKAHNENKDEKGDLQRARKLLSNINSTKKKLKELGIGYDFFTPVDVPEQLQNAVKVEKEISVVSNKIIKKADDKKDTSNRIKTKLDDKHEKIDLMIKKADDKKDTSNRIKTKLDDKHEKVKLVKNKELNKNIIQSQADKNTLKEKLKGKGVQPMEEFIKVQRDSDNDSDSSFNSDEFEKMMLSDEEDSDVLGTDDSYKNKSSDSESHEGEEEFPAKINKRLPKSPQVLPKKKNVEKNISKTETQPQQQLDKRQRSQKLHVATLLAPEFGKKNVQKPRNRQFKKK